MELPVMSHDLPSGHRVQDVAPSAEYVPEAGGGVSRRVGVSRGGGLVVVRSHNRVRGRRISSKNGKLVPEGNSAGM